MSVPTWGQNRAAEVLSIPDINVEDCGGDCPTCRVREAGGRALCDFLGVDYEADPALAQHMRHMASHVFEAMSEAILAQTEPVEQAGEQP